jgi:hypothetical protein
LIVSDLGGGRDCADVENNGQKDGGRLSEFEPSSFYAGRLKPGSPKQHLVGSLLVIGLQIRFCGCSLYLS